MKDSVVCAHTPNGPTPLFMHGQKIVCQGPYWFYDRAYQGPCNINLVELCTYDGKWAIHYFDSSFSYVTNNINDLEEDTKYQILEMFYSAFKEMWLFLTYDINTVSSNALHVLHNFGVGSRREFSRFLKDLILPADNICVYNASADLSPQIFRPGLQGLFAVNLPDAQIAGIAQDEFSLPSPFGPHNNKSIHSLLFQYNEYYCFYAYKFIEHATKVVYYVICGDWNSRILALFVPSLCLTLFPTNEHHAFYTRAAHETVRDSIYTHFSEYVDVALDYFNAASKGSVLVTHYWHLGHHLWNELTGLKRTADVLPGRQSPPVVVVDDGQSEIFGKIDQIFPVFAGKVDRSVRSTRDLCTYLYTQRRLMLHPTHDHIDEALAARIMDVAAKAPYAPGINVRLSQFREQGCRIVVLGLRVENRTLTDLAQFCIDVILGLKARSHRVAVIIDGHNRPEGANADHSGFRSLHDQSSIRSPMDAELAVVSELLSAFYRDSRVEIVSTIGLPVGASVHWCANADFYITPWGAGLAKYKWVCNKPGLIVSNSHFLTMEEAYLYDAPAHRDTPERTFRVSPNDVEDVPDVDLTIPFRDPLRTNFRVEPSAVNRELDALIRYVDGKSTPTLRTSNP